MYLLFSIKYIPNSTFCQIFRLIIWNKELKYKDEFAKYWCNLCSPTQVTMSYKYSQSRT